MEIRRTPLTRLTDFIHHHLVWLLVAVYGLAGVAPSAGAWLRSSNLLTTVVAGEQFTLSLPSLLLALLLFNAGLGAESRHFGELLGKSGVLAVGLLANVAIPLLFIVSLWFALPLWDEPDEVQYILVGLALIAAMPVAGSSTAWSQNANGDLALSLGLVVGSTLLSPITTPAILHVVGWLTEGTFADSLHHLASGGTRSFLVAFVLIPSLAGMASRCFFGSVRVQRIRPVLKATNSANLLVLGYVNAAVSLPATFADPDWDFLALMLVVVTSLCVLGFAAGVVVARMLRVDASRRNALVFGLGMTNNGTGLVLATTALAHIPEVILPVIVCNLVQQVIAAVAQRRLHRMDRSDPSSTEAEGLHQ
jgi:BASS family bile acid:Na+ symporter